MIPKYLRNRVDFYTRKGGKAEEKKKGEDKNSENINYNGIQPIQVYCFCVLDIGKRNFENNMFTNFRCFINKYRSNNETPNKL